MNYVNLVQRIRACESEVTAQLVLEKWIERFQYTVGVDIGKQRDQCHVVVVCKHFEGSPAFIVYSQDLTAQTGPQQPPKPIPESWATHGGLWIEALYKNERNQP
jgi:hypothetical protein